MRSSRLPRLLRHHIAFTLFFEKAFQYSKPFSRIVIPYKTPTHQLIRTALSSITRAVSIRLPCRHCIIWIENFFPRFNAPLTRRGFLGTTHESGRPWVRKKSKATTTDDRPLAVQPKAVFRPPGRRVGEGSQGCPRRVLPPGFGIQGGYFFLDLY